MSKQLVSESRLQNSKKNVISGLIKQVVGIVLTFLIRTAVVYFLGSQYQGLNGLFNSILQVLNLADLGFSSAVTFILYKPIAEGDEETICGIIAFLRKIYRIIGLVVLLIGIGVSFFLPLFISNGYPADINIYVLFYIFLINASISYFLYAYKSTLLTALQKDNIVSNAYTITNTLVKVLQLTVLVIFRNFYVYAIVLPIGTVLNNLIVQYYSKKHFSSLIPKGIISQDLKKILNKQVRAVFINRISDVARNSFDNIIVSSLLGLTIVAAYDTYYYILSAILGSMAIIVQSIRASVGNSLVKESVEKNYNDLLKFSFIFMWIAGFCTVCLICLYQPFMQFWTQLMNDENLVLPFHTMVLFCVYFYIFCVTHTKNIYLEAKGYFWECRYFYVIESLANLGLNVLLGYLFGVDGILIATIITLLVLNFIPGTIILFKNYFNKGMNKFLLKHLIYILSTAVNCFVLLWICDLISIDGIAGIVTKLAICIFVANAIFLLLYFRTREFKSSVYIVNKLIKRR